MGESGGDPGGGKELVEWVRTWGVQGRTEPRLGWLPGPLPGWRLAWLEVDTSPGWS